MLLLAKPFNLSAIPYGILDVPSIVDHSASNIPSLEYSYVCIFCPYSEAPLRQQGIVGPESVILGLSGLRGGEAVEASTVAIFSIAVV